MGESLNLRDVHRSQEDQGNEANEPMDEMIARELESSKPIDAKDLVGDRPNTKIDRFGELEAEDEKPKA